MTWNEQQFLPHFLRHYSNLGATITLYDNESTDATVDIARAWPNVRVRTFSTGRTLRDDVNADIKSTAWQEDDAPDADWVICVDADELIHHADLKSHLRACDDQEISVVVPAGFDMAPVKDPASVGTRAVTTLAQRGTYNALYSKPVVFSARRIRGVTFGPGAHAARFEPQPRISGDVHGQPGVVGSFPGTLVLQRETVDLSQPKLLHYRFFDRNRVRERWASVEARRSQLNRDHGFGSHYSLTEDQRRQYLDWVEGTAQVVT